MSAAVLRLSLRQVATVSALLGHARHDATGAARRARFRDRRVRALVRHAYDRVPYYRELFDRAGVRPDDVRTAADLAHVPPTTKADLRAVPLEARLARGVDPATLVTHSTGGSTGLPFVIRRGWLEDRVLAVLRRRALAEYGIGWREPVAVVQFPHADPDVGRRRRVATRVVVRAPVLVDCLQPPEVVLATLARLRPAVVGGYAGVLDRLASLVAASGDASVRPRVVLSGGEVLAPLVARRIAQAFGVPVRDTYGAHEFGRIAWQCPRGDAYHVCDDGVLVEVLHGERPAAAGEWGELVGTALHSFAMPFIRYRLGDEVRRGADRCACGRAVSTLTGIRGRTVDHFPLADGRVLHPYELVAALQPHAMRWVGRYQVVQIRRDLVELRVVTASEPTERELARLHEAAARVLGPYVGFVLQRVPELALGERGKFRIYRSLVASSHDAATDAATDAPVS